MMLCNTEDFFVQTKWNHYDQSISLMVTCNLMTDGLMVVMFESHMFLICMNCHITSTIAVQGFKKRYPPGTRLKDVPVFMCPVCGARKEQFVVMDEEKIQS